MVSKLVSVFRSLAPFSRHSGFRPTAAAVLLAVPAAALLLAGAVHAQAPIPFPYTVTTVAGGGATTAAGAACSAGSQYKAADTYGNGCPGLNANFSSDLRGGLASDAQGNIYIADTSNSMVRRYDPKTGIVSRVIGKSTNCTAANGLLDSSGDGCPSLQTSLASTPRGLATDPYGNVLFAGYGTQMVHVICTATSPLCPGTTGRKQIGFMYRVAGCVAAVGGVATGASATAVAAGTEGDNSYASPFSNLSGDAGVSTGTVAGGTCSNSVGILNQPRGVAADKYGNVFIAETGTTNVGLRYRVVLGPQIYNGVTNPLFAIINNASYVPLGGTATSTYTAHEGYIYTLLGGFAGTPAAAGACGAYTATDAKGDGCPFTYSSANGGEQGVTVDNSGNVIVGDIVNTTLRVLYAGGASAAANPLYPALVANGVAAPVAGNVYLLAGGGPSSVTTTAALGNTVALSTGISKPTIGPGGNIYIGDFGNNQVDFYDVTTGYVRVLFKTGTVCAAHVVGSSNGDGCPVGGFTFTGGSGLGVAVDPLGNLYFGDSEGSSLIRKVEAVSLVPTIVGSSTAANAAFTQTLNFHGPKGTTGVTATALNSSADITIGATTCAAANGDQTTDCTLPITFAPAQPGPRTLNLAVAATGASGTLGSQVFAVSGNGVGTALVADVATPTTAVVTAPGVVPVGAAIGGAGNLYSVNTASSTVLRTNIASGTATTVGTAPSSPSQVSVDTAGNVYVTSAANASVTKYALGASGAYTAGAVTLPSAIATPQATVYDASGNAFIADKATGSVYEVPAGTAFNTTQPSVIIAAGFTNPVGLAIDGVGNLFVADSGVPGVFKVANVNGVMTTSLYAAAAAANVTATPGATAASAAPAITVAGLVPVSVAADAGGNVYVQDSASKKVFNIPVTANSSSTANVANTATVTTVLTGLTTPSGVAVDGNGVLYSADSGAGSVVQVQRNNASYAFGSMSGTANATSGYFTNAGNLATTGLAQTTSSEFLYDQTGTYTCGTIPSTSNILYAGDACQFNAYFNPATSGNAVTSSTTFLAASSTTGAFRLTGQEPNGTTYTTTVNISAPSPASPVYTGTATTATFTISVTASGTTDVPTGSITVTTSCTTGAGSYTLSNGSVSVPVSGCTAGAQNISASYSNTPDSTTSGASFGASSTTSNFNVMQAATAVTWSPSTTTQQYSAAIGAGVLDATAAASSNGATVPGFFLYTATPSGATPVTVHAASFLPIGTYTLNVTFMPTDGTDFGVSYGTISNYTVTKATTTAGLGASQFLVATDGSGNYTSVQAAVNALGANGGSVYMKPGTYAERVSVLQPNVALRGLGGDPTQVILTHAFGAFGSSTPGVQSYAGEFQATGINGAQLPSGSTTASAGDPGSATLAIYRGVNTAIGTTSLIPSNFYGENFTVQNTYDSDNTTTTTTYLPSANSGVCAANQGAAQTYFALYNQSLLCASQALAIYNAGDLGVMNNVYAASLQDTAGLGSTGSTALGYPSRLYWFRGKITGNVDYIFGDGAVAFDYTTIYSQQNKSGGTGGPGTVHAQSKQTALGSSNDYLSGYVFNGNVFTSGTSNTYQYFGRPYGPYSTFVLLNAQVDEVLPAGYEEFSGKTNLPTSTFVEFNTQAYTDPATGTPDPNGVPYLGNATYTGYGVTSSSTPVAARETTSQDPGTPEASNSVKTSLTAAQATLYYPAAFLGTPVSSTYSATASFNPTSALATNVNAFTGSATSASVVGGSSVTILMRPQTPGLGAITNGTYTIPTGTYSLSDTVNGSTTTLASGSLDASGEATFTSSSLLAGTHTMTWTYGGDANFSGSTSSSYTLTVTGASTTTTLSTTAANNTITYGQSAPVTVTVASASGTPTGMVTLTIDGTTTQTGTLSGGAYTFSVTGLTAGNHSFSAMYGGATMFTASASTNNLAVTVSKAVLTITPACANRYFDQQNSCSITAVSGYQYADTASTVFSVQPIGTTAATPTSPVSGSPYPDSAAYTLSAFGNANYTIAIASATFTVMGNTPQAVIFAQLPNFPHGSSYMLTARATSGLPITYSITAGSGIASVSGSTLTVTGTGTVTVTATSAPDSTGDYASASASSTFTAQ